jgi:alpha-amylase/alpha-mannosidase (GH57 family)
LSRVHLAILWHMHQPQYREPGTGRYVLPWTRLHALKDYWGMVKVLEAFPGVHATYNFVPSLGAQIEEYASGKFNEPWFDLAFAPAESLKPEQRLGILDRAFQVNDQIRGRWPRFQELYQQVRLAGREACAQNFSSQDWLDLQALSQIAWMDEEYLAKDPVVCALSMKAKGYTEDDKKALRDKEIELLGAVLPEYRLAAERGQIEISTTPFYHPILPLVCDTDIARVSNPGTPLPNPPFRYPEDAREHLVRARQYHERVFGKPPAGLWPSEGSVSDQVLEIAGELGFQWFATDEGVLGRTRNIGFWRDAAGLPENAQELYTPWRLDRNGRSMAGIFRDHYLSDLVGFVYSRMSADAAATDLHARIRAIGERQPAGKTATVGLILDGENAWEYYPGNGREFLRQFYGRIEKDAEIKALTVSEAIAAAPDAPKLDHIFPASWINANFDVWIGHAEDVRAWDLLREAREAYGRAAERSQNGGGVTKEQLATAFESVMAAEGSDWCWWYGPEHGSANDLEFDALYRKHLAQIYLSIGENVPPPVEIPIKRAPDRAKREPPLAYVDAKVDGRESTYFEWLGAGVYSKDARGGTMHGQTTALRDIFYGFAEDRLFVRVDPMPKALDAMPSFQLGVTMWDARETRITLRIEGGKLAQTIVEQGGLCLLHPESVVSAAYSKIFELSVAREMFDLAGRRVLLLSAALWEGGLPLDALPLEGMLEIALGEENFAWPPAKEPVSS